MVIPIKIRLDEDIKMIPDMLLDVASEQHQVLKYPELFVTFEGYGESSYTFTLRAFFPRVDKLMIQSYLHEAIIGRLIEE